MALWTNTADGWGSDPSASGNGALASYLQSSSASSPTSQSSRQAQDPGNSAPTSSVARTVMPAQSTLATAVLQPTAQAPVATTSAAVPQTAAKFSADIAPSQPAFVAPTAVTAPSYTGPTTFALNTTSYGNTGNLQGATIYALDPTTLQPTVIGYRTVEGSGGLLGSGFKYGYTDANGNKIADNDPRLAQLGNATALSGTGSGNAAQQLATATQLIQPTIQATLDGRANALTQNQANLQTATDTQTQAYYLQYLTDHNGQLPPSTGAQSLDGGAADNKLRSAAMAEYQANQASAAAIRQGIVPVDTSTQDAANQSSLAALTSRFSTNNFGNNVGQMGRLFQQAVAEQGGTNQQLSNEDYAARFDQNMAAFQQAVSNQGTLDANATGTKLQSDVQAISDAVDSLNQQVTQLGTKAGLAVSAQLNGLQQQINKYNEAARAFGNGSAYAVGLFKGILGAAAALTAVVAAPATGGASLAAGAVAAKALS